MPTRITWSTALVSVTLASCARDRPAPPSTADAPPAADSVAHLVSSTVERCGLAFPLQCADRGYIGFWEQRGAALLAAYRLPEDADRRGTWRQYNYVYNNTQDDTDSTKAPYWTKGDFNNDGTTDYAYILIRRADSAKALFAFLSSGSEYTTMLLDDSMDAEMLLATQGAGTFQTASGKGYWEPTEDQPATITVEKHAIAFIMAESAASIFVWDKGAHRFRRIWISD